MFARPALRNRVGLTLLGLSLLLALWMATRGIGAAGIGLVGWGLLAYMATAFIEAQRHAPAPLVTPNSVPPPPPDEPTPVDTREFVRLVEQALRNLNRSAALSQSELIAHLPRTLAAGHARRPGHADEPTPLLHAQALREVLVAAIERLNPGGEGQSVEYGILHREYVLGWATGAIQVKESISESTFHRYRQKAIAALADDLRRQEQARRERRSGTPDPVAMDYLG